LLEELTFLKFQETKIMFLHVHRIILSVVILVMFTACSNSEDQVEENRIKETTDKIAHEAVINIKTPIDQAKLVKELTEQHNSAIEENVIKQ
jgi:hypothetical protein